MKKVVCFGEIMLRLNPQGYLRFVQADAFEASWAGSEANVAVSLACLGAESAFVSKVPAHEIGQCAVNALRQHGVDASRVLRGGERLGIYYLEKGASQRSGKVIYDRAHSAIAEAKPEEFDWETILKGADWFHFSGITPALSDACAQMCLDAAQTARRLGIKVSCDLNYRRKLWSGEQAGKAMSGIMPFVDVCIANGEAAEELFGIRADGSSASGKGLRYDESARVAALLGERFGFEKVAMTLRGGDTASDNIISALLYSGGKAYTAPEYAVRIVDRVGGGDAFDAGLIYAELQGWEAQRAVNFAVAADCLKHSLEQDYNLVSASEVEALANGGAAGRVDR